MSKWLLGVDVLSLVGWVYAVFFAVFYCIERRNAKRAAALTEKVLGVMKHNTDEWFRVTHEMVVNNRKNVVDIARAAGVDAKVSEETRH